LQEIGRSKHSMTDVLADPSCERRRRSRGSLGSAKKKLVCGLTWGGWGLKGKGRQKRKWGGEAVKKGKSVVEASATGVTERLPNIESPKGGGVPEKKREKRRRPRVGRGGLRSRSYVKENQPKGMIVNRQCSICKGHQGPSIPQKACKRGCRGLKICPD